jgi:ribulose-bisphosphate carboxylase large chain
MSRECLRVAYRISAASEARARGRAEDVALEQTVEVPRQVVRDAFVEDQVLGRVEDLRPDAAGSWRATIAYPVATTAFDPAQLVNVLFGNSSLHADVSCLDAELPASLLSTLQGPRFGIAGLRKALGVYDRALTCTAVKPMGLSPKALAGLLREFARAGIDLIKDDHGLADQAFCPFEERVEACLAAAAQVAEETGHRAVYVPNLSGTPEAVFRQLRFAESRGARAVMVSPMLIGLPVFWELCQRRASVPVLAHPAFGGFARLAPELLFGRLFRLLGADAVIYVSFGGRFGTDRATSQRIAEALRAPWGGLRPSLPVPAGGIELENAQQVAEFYGRDSMLLVGGSLQLEPGGVARRSRAFVDAVRRAPGGASA